ncbi:MAG: radical SAM protein, partial [Myxococcales bacterium]
LRNHGTSSIRYGRGSVLTVDLTNRCNMMCDPCFMDANQVGYVYEPDWPTIKRILDDSLSIEPRRQMSIQFSGGEPTLSPRFLDAIQYARQIGYFCVQCASNGIRFAQDAAFCRAAKEAGLRLVYLQFDGTSNHAHAHRKVGNLFDVKQRAIENLHAAGIDVVLVVTVVRGVNDAEVGKIVEFAIQNADKITVVSFQPVSFTGRDEDISDEERASKRYTLSHLAHDLEDQIGLLRPLRDWFPLSAMTPISDVVDLMNESRSEMGALNCGCHPNCGIGTILLVHKRTKQVIPLSQILDLDQLLVDLQTVSEWQANRSLSALGLAGAVIRNFRTDAAPADYRLRELIRQAISQIGVRGGKVGQSEGDSHEFPWRFLFVAGMWFQDLWTYDFRRTEMCVIPQGTEMGEISFCAYNTGVGWRQVVEKIHRTASTAEWYKQHGRHAVYARGQELPLPGQTIPLVAKSNQDGRRRLKLVG